MAKSAQATLTKILADVNKDVHIALVMVGGRVTFKEEEINPQNVAVKFWELYKQMKRAWQFEKKIGC